MFLSLAGQFDNVFLHGTPDTFCHQETCRSNATTPWTCKPKKDTCQRLNSYVQRAKKINVLIDMHYCANSDFFGLEYDLSGVFPVGIYPTHFSILPNISLMRFHSSFRAEALTYIPQIFVTFTGNNHGSWVELVVESARELKIKNQFLGVHQNYIQEFIPVGVSLPPIYSLKKQFSVLGYVLWFHSRCDDQNLRLNLSLETFSKFGRQSSAISLIKWQGIVKFDNDRPNFCISTPEKFLKGNISIFSSGMFFDGSQDKHSFFTVIHPLETKSFSCREG